MLQASVRRHPHHFDASHALKNIRRRQSERALPWVVGEPARHRQQARFVNLVKKDGRVEIGVNRVSKTYGSARRRCQQRGLPAGAKASRAILHFGIEGSGEQASRCVLGSVSLSGHATLST